MENITDKEIAESVKDINPYLSNLAAIVLYFLKDNTQKKIGLRLLQNILKNIAVSKDKVGNRFYLYMVRILVGSIKKVRPMTHQKLLLQQLFS
jgi:hypothetical protein